MDGLLELERSVTAHPSAVTAHRPEIELSIVIPCLNEVATLPCCIEKAQTAMREAGISGEIIVADNGSTDGSAEVAAWLGARVVHVPERGYGSALLGGIAAATGRYVVMADADDSYDLGDLGRFVEKLRAGFDLVQGCRLPRGGGRIMPGAMPRLHRWWGNPMFTMMVRRIYRAPVNDVYCGMRGFTKRWFERLDLRSRGMEFAVEMVIKSSLFGARIAEVPITLHCDGRTAHPPHLRTFSDGWRTVRYFLLFSPRWLFFVPGALMIALGILGYALALPGVSLFGARLDAHTLLVASLLQLVGQQALFFGLFAKTFGVTEGLLPPDDRLTAFFQTARLGRGLALGTISCLVGALLLGATINTWRIAGFGPLDYAYTMRLAVPGVTAIALGTQTILASFLISMLGMARLPRSDRSPRDVAARTADGSA